MKFNWLADGKNALINLDQLCAISLEEKRILFYFCQMQSTSTFETEEDAKESFDYICQILREETIE